MKTNLNGRGRSRSASRPPPERIESALFRQAGRNAHRTALADGKETISYGVLAARAVALARTLRHAGLRPGDRAAIFLKKGIDMVVAFYAIWQAGGIAVPVNDGLRPRQVDHILNDSASRLVITGPRLAERLSPDVVENRTLVDPSRLPPTSSHAAPRDPAGGHEPALILYTSGSTGRPKGVLISHANLTAGTRIVAGYLELSEDERILSVLPFCFDYGLNQLLTAVHCGAALVLQRSALAADVCRALERHEITGLAGVPPMWIQLWQRHSPFRSMRFPRLRYITNSGGRFPVELVRHYRDHLPHTRIFLMYGLTEAFRSAYLPPDEIDRRPGSIGLAIPETELLVVGENGEPVACGEAGELVHHGPTVCLGYWNDPEATAAVFRPHPVGNGTKPTVVFSGDRVKQDETGFLHFVGRHDQLMKRMGHRVNPEEIEEVLHVSDQVSEVVVEGRTDPVADTAIVAHVVPADPERFSRRALLDLCRREMPPYMIPSEVEVHSTFPRLPSGKIDRSRVKS